MGTSARPPLTRAHPEAPPRNRAHEVELDWPEKHHPVADDEAMIIMASGAHKRCSSRAFSSSFLQLSHGQQDIKMQCKFYL